MCLEDIRLGRQLAAAATQVSVTAGTPLVVLGPDPHRTRVAVSGDGVGTVLVGFDGATAAAARGFVIPPQVGIFEFEVEKWGKLLTGPVMIAVAAGTVVVSIAVASLEKQ